MKGITKIIKKKKLDMKVNDTKGLYNVCECYWENTKKQLKILAHWDLTVTLLLRLHRAHK